jgi:hypothetical protein
MTFIRMVYDTKTVLTRYQQIQDLPEGEADESTCPLAGDSRPLHAIGCEPGGCQSCCLGVVEIVRRYNERCLEAEAKVGIGESVDTSAD